MRHAFLQEHPSLDPHLAILDVNYALEKTDPTIPFQLRFTNLADVYREVRLSKELDDQANMVNIMKESLTGAQFYIAT